MHSMNTLLSLKLLSFTLLISLSILSFTSALQAEQLIKSNGYSVHYNAFNSSMLSADVANQYDIERSPSLGVLTLSVLDKSDAAVTALVLGEAKNAISQLTTLKFKKVTEGKAIYFIATFNFAENEFLDFDVTIVADGTTDRIKLKFRQQLFVE